MPVLTESPKATAGQVSIATVVPPAKGQKIVYDSHRAAPKGFGVRITPSGNRTFILRYMVAGAERRMTIGPWGPNQWSLAAARARAGELRRVVDDKRDPLMERRVKNRALTVDEAVSQFAETYATRASGKRIKRTLERYLVKPLGKLKLSDVRRSDIREIVEALAKDHGRQAHHLLAYCKLLFAWAEDAEIIDANPVQSLKPAKIHVAMKPTSRARVLTDDEIRTLWNSAETCGMHRLTALALKMILVTGQRPGEVAGMRSVELGSVVHPDDAKQPAIPVWTIAAARRGKTNTAHVVPLTDTARALIESARDEIKRLEKRRGKGDHAFVFEARPGKPLTPGALDVAVVRFADKIGNAPGENAPKEWERWRPHDLRRTVRTALAALGTSDVVAELVIGHTRKGIAGVYDLHSYLVEKRAALEAWERRLLRIVSGEPANNVIRLEAMRRAAQ